MKVTFASLVIAAGICGLLSFVLLATSLGTEYWYIIEMNPQSNASDFEDMSSHSGLWSINEGGQMNAYIMDSFMGDYSGYSDAELHLLNMHRAVVVLLPLSLVLLLFGGVCGLVSSLVRSHVLLTSAASYFFICKNSPDTAMCFFCLKELEGWEPEDDPEKEHKSHSSSCQFITLKKKLEDLTVEEFFKLQKERHKYIIKKSCNDAITKFEDAAKVKRADIIKTAMGEE